MQNRWLIVVRLDRLLLKLFECRLHQLDRIFARPFGRARDGADLTALRIEEDGGRHADGAADQLEVLEHLGAGVGVIAEPRDADLLEPRTWLFGIPGIDIDRDDLKLRAAELGLQLVERRHLLAARDAPGCPKVKKDGAAPPLREVALAAITSAEREVGNEQRPACHHDAGDLAAGERRDPSGRLHGWPALGVPGPIA